MASSIGSIVRKVIRRTNEQYNCITFPTHERYQSNLAKCNTDFYMLQGTPGVKGNGWITSYAEMPQNHILLPKVDNPLQALPAWLEVDFVLGQHKFGQSQTAIQLAQYFGCPSILLEHTTVTNEQLRAAVPQLKEIRGDINVFISRSSAEAWGWSIDDPSVEIIHHGVDTDLFRPAYAVDPSPHYHVLCVVNDWVNRGDILGWDIFQRVVANNQLPARILGDNAGISKPPPNVYSLVKAYQECSLYYNTSRHSPIPSVILEAMACGKPVVTTDNYLISDLIVNGVNGYKTNSEDEQLKHIRRMLKDPAECRELGANARETILKDFPLQKFVERWNAVFDRVARK